MNLVEAINHGKTNVQAKCTQMFPLKINDRKLSNIKVNYKSNKPSEKD